MIRVEARGSGVAIVRVRGRFVGRVLRVGTAWQAWALGAEAPALTFVGWSARRRDAVTRLTGL